MIFESSQVLGRLKKSASGVNKKKIEMLQIILKEQISEKRKLAKKLEVSSTTVQNWLRKYREGRTAALLKKPGKKKSLIRTDVHKSIANLITRDFKSVTELLAKINIRFKPTIKYSTFIKYCKRKFPKEYAMLKNRRK